MYGFNPIASIFTSHAVPELNSHRPDVQPHLPEKGKGGLQEETHRNSIQSLEPFILNTK
jgi:hypothetical protein